jgi:tetratricopeptide (TPR) repeat protein
LDGLPLAIELAAARVNIFTPQQLLGRLYETFTLLSRGDQDNPTRQQTLRATFKWSYELLTGPEQTLLGMLAVFEGGCTMESIDAICEPFMPGGSVIPDVVASLVDKSLLTTGRGGPGGVRFRMLETIRAYAKEKLSASSRAREVENAHSRYFLTLAGSTHAHAIQVHRGTWLRILEDEYRNIRAALLRGDAGDPAAAMRAASAMSEFWITSGRVEEGRVMLRQLDTPGKFLPQVKLDALQTEARLFMAQNDFQPAVDNLLQGLELARQIGNQRDAALCLSDLGLAELERGNIERARALLEEALDAWTSLGDEHNVGGVVANQMRLEIQHGDRRKARLELERLASKFRNMGAMATLAAVLNNVGSVSSEEGDFQYSNERHREALTISEQRGDVDGIATAKHNLGTNALAQGDLETAKQLLLQSYQLRSDSGNYRGLELTCKNLGWVYYEEHDLEAASRMYKEFVAHASDIGDETMLREAIHKLGTLRVIQQQWQRGITLLAASGLSAVNGAIAVAFDKPAFDVSFNAGVEALGRPVLEESWREGLGLNLSEAVEVAMEDDPN